MTIRFHDRAAMDRAAEGVKARRKALLAELFNLRIETKKDAAKIAELRSALADSESETTRANNRADDLVSEITQVAFMSPGEFNDWKRSAPLRRLKEDGLI